MLVAWIALTMPMGTLGIDTNLEEQLLDHGAQRILAQNMPKSDISRYDIAYTPAVDKRLCRKNGGINGH